MALSRPSRNPFPDPAWPLSPGWRTRLVLGRTGSDFVVVAKSDDGKTQSQAVVSAGPSVEGIAQQIRNSESIGWYVSDIDYDPGTGAWFVATKETMGIGWRFCLSPNLHGSAALDLILQRANRFTTMSLGSTRDDQGNLHVACVVRDDAWRRVWHTSNIALALANRMQALMPFHLVKLSDRGGYFLKDDVGVTSGGLPPALAGELVRRGFVHDVAIASDGNWVVIRSDDFSCSPGISSELVNHLTEFYNYQKRQVQERREAINAINAQWRAVEEQARRAEAAVIEVREQERGSMANNVVAPQAVAMALGPPPRDARVVGVEPPREARLVEEANWIPDEQDADDEDGDGSCVICMAGTAVRALNPCGHLCLCNTCSTTLMNSSPNPTCPMCRTAVISSLRIFRRNR